MDRPLNSRHTEPAVGTVNLNLDKALEALRARGHAVRIIGPYSNGQRLVEVDQIIRSHHEIVQILSASQRTMWSGLEMSHNV